MSNTIAQSMKLISENFENMAINLADIYRQLLINILKNNQVVVDPNATLSQVWELAEPYVNDSYLKASVLGLLKKPSVIHVFFAWDWVGTSVGLYGDNLFSQNDDPIQNSIQEQVKDKNAKDLQDFFEKVLFCLKEQGFFERTLACLQGKSRDFKIPSFQTLTRTEEALTLARVEKILAKQEHHPLDTFLLKLAKASLQKDTLEIFGAVLILLEYAEKPEAKSILFKDNANFKKGVVTHLKAVESSINDFLWRKADGDKLIYKHLIDLFTYLAKAQ